MNRRFLVVLFVLGAFAAGFGGGYVVGRRPTPEPVTTSGPSTSQPVGMGGMPGMPDGSLDTAVVVMVDIPTPGLARDEAEQLVAAPVDAALVQLAGVRRAITRVTAAGVQSSVRFQDNVDVHRSRQDAADALSVLAARWPTGVGTPLLRVGAERSPLVWLVLQSATRPVTELGDLAETVRQRLAMIPEVTDVRLSGTAERVARITLDPDKLRAFGLAPAEVAVALEQQASAAGARDRLRDRTGELQGLERTVLATRAGAPVYLRDVGAVDVVSRPHGVALWKGRPAVAVGVVAAHLTSEKAAALVSDLRNELPADVQINLFRLKGRPADTRPYRVELQFPSGMSSEETVRVVGQIADQFRRSWDTLAVVPHDPLDRPVLWTAVTEGEIADAAVRNLLTVFPGVRGRATDLAARPNPADPRYSVELALVGPERERLGEWATRLLAKLDAGEAVADADASPLTLVPELTVRIDRDKAAVLGVSAKQIAAALNLERGLTLSGRPYEVRIAGPDGPAERLRTALVHADDAGRIVRLMDVAAVETVQVPNELARLNGQRAVFVAANPAPKVTVEQARERSRKLAEELARELKLPDTYRAIDVSGP